MVSNGLKHWPLGLSWLFETVEVGENQRGDMSDKLFIALARARLRRGVNRGSKKKGKRGQTRSRRNSCLRNIIKRSRTPHRSVISFLSNLFLRNYDNSTIYMPSMSSESKHNVPKMNKD